MGSGGLVVMDENSCMVDVARFFMSFTQRESCGKCTPCRIGTKRMLEILDKITEGKGTLEDLDKLEETANTVRTMSLCGLGKGVQLRFGGGAFLILGGAVLCRKERSAFKIGRAHV